MWLNVDLPSQIAAANRNTSTVRCIATAAAGMLGEEKAASHNTKIQTHAQNTSLTAGCVEPPN